MVRWSEGETDFIQGKIDSKAVASNRNTILATIVTVVCVRWLIGGFGESYT